VAINQTLNLIGIRIWGGHVLVFDGVVTFNGCIFYDLELLTPFSDRIYFGGDVLVRALCVGGMGGIACLLTCVGCLCVVVWGRHTRACVCAGCLLVCLAAVSRSWPLASTKTHMHTHTHINRWSLARRTLRAVRGSTPPSSAWRTG
jgi:hypothetical protein